jgi:hypothetical protein
VNAPHSAEALARVWIERWNEGTPDLIPLAENFTHSSPYGRVEGRRKYLDWVKPLAKQNVTELKIVRTIGSANEAVVHFEMQTPAGLIQVCDWVVVENGQITEIHSFYDATELR